MECCALCWLVSLGRRYITDKVDIDIDATVLHVERKIRSIVSALRRAEGGEEGVGNVKKGIDGECALDRARAGKKTPGAFVFPREHNIVGWF
jgi:hypothetical protein